MPLPLMRLLPDLPAEARADLRYHAGFGCVRCGVTVYRYLSLPALRDSGPDGEAATMLCPPCHDLVEEGRLTAAQVHGFHASPIARQRHFSREHLPFSNDLPELLVGGPRLVRDTPIPIAIEGQPLLLFAPPRQGVGAIRISLCLGNANGGPQRIIDGNEWLVSDGAWSFAQRGDRYRISASSHGGLAVLRIVTRNRIAVEHLRTDMLGYRVEITPDWIEVNGQRLVDQIPSGMLVGLEF